MKVKALAEWLGADWEGDGEVELTGVADLKTAGAKDASFATGPRAAREVEGSRAGCVLMPLTGPVPPGRNVIRVKDPRRAFARLVRRFHPEAPVAAGVHPTAVVSPEAILEEGVAVGAWTVIGARSRIGRGAVIGAGCHIGEEVELGEGTRLCDNVTVYRGVQIGCNAVLHSGAVIGADGFGFVLAGDHYEKFPQIGRVVIGDDVEIGANSCVDRAALGTTRIGDGTKLDNLVQVGHNATIGKHVVIAAQTGISGGAVIGDYVVIAGQVGIGEKARIEPRAVLGGQCGVLSSKIVRSGEKVWGTPARPLKEHLEQLAHLGAMGELRGEMARLRKRVEELEREM